MFFNFRSRLRSSLVNVRNFDAPPIHNHRPADAKKFFIDSSSIKSDDLLKMLFLRRKKLSRVDYSNDYSVTVNGGMLPDFSCTVPINEIFRWDSFYSLTYCHRLPSAPRAMNRISMSGIQAFKRYSDCKWAYFFVTGVTPQNYFLHLARYITSQ
ncbi:hypothetical protein NPIL_660071 [Nephila pilipes]|uniref:Uncharacterized protein n=1 Tax=Nephila pilipes TaxID=299642 RepID=A0A8X6MCZ4_NEPPI|nr:hypothetical protein NPIL_660071 [Nephila pilipes]